MLLSRLQDLIGGIYDVPIAHDVYDFLVTERTRLPPPARAAAGEEELVIVEERDVFASRLFESQVARGRGAAS